MEEATTDVTENVESPVLDTPSSVDSAPAIEGEKLETPVEGKTEEAAAPFQVPENDDDLKGQEANPHVQSIAQLRQELRERNQRLDSYKPLESWKEIATAIPDPALAQSAYELASAIHTPSTDNPSGFTSRPFLEKLESESPGSVDQLFADTLTFTIPDEAGQPSTVVRELVKSWGLNPDRFDDYRNIDTLRASGVVTAEDLGAIPEKYHAAFKSLSTAQRDDILAQKQTDTGGKVTYPAFTLDYLQDKAEALEARSWREKDAADKQAAIEQQRAADEQQVTASIEQDIVTESQAIANSIHQNLSSQFTFSSDATVNALEHAKILGVIGNLQSPFPVYRDMALKALKSVGVEPNGFDELTNRLEERRAAYVRFNAIGDKMQAAKALSDATLAKQQILAKGNDYAMKLAKASGERAAAGAAQQEQQLAAATARFVPSGSGQAQQGATNPYLSNPHPIGSPEWSAYYKQIDKQVGLGGASMLGSN